MLALTRKKDEAIIIDGGIEIKILDIQGDKVKLGISAPKEVNVYREEVYENIRRNNQEATQTNKMSIKELERMFMK